MMKAWRHSPQTLRDSIPPKAIISHAVFFDTKTSRRPPSDKVTHCHRQGPSAQQQQGGGGSDMVQP